MFWDAVMFLAGFWVLVFAFYLDARFLEGLLGRISTGTTAVHADFDSFWRSVDAFLRGGDLYRTGAQFVNLNPPVWTVLISPLGLLDPIVAYRLFVVLSVAATVGYLAWTAAELRLTGGWAVVGAAMLLLSSPLLGTLALGQVYPVLALGLVAAWVADRRGRWALSGGALGVVVALKPSLAPVILWPLARRRWGTAGAAAVSGAVATFVGFVVAGPGATFRYAEVLRGASVSPYWDNASIPSAAARLFTDNPFAMHVATLPWTVTVAYVLGAAVVLLTAARARGDAGLWALVAASLLASPVAWHNYLVLLAPGVLLLLARGWVAPAFLLLSLQAIPPQWPLLWSGQETVLASLALTLYLPILAAHWLAFLTVPSAPADSPEPEQEPGPEAVGAS